MVHAVMAMASGHVHRESWSGLNYTGILDITDVAANSDSIAMRVLPDLASLANAVEARQLLLLTMTTDQGYGM